MTKHESFPMVFLSALLIALFSTMIVIGHASSHNPALVETRYCGEPKRNAAGEIIRSSAVRAAFQFQNPCPSNGNRVGPCPGYSVNHDKPMACGGCDAVRNMSWMRNDVKRLHDSYERKINGGHIETAACSAVPPGGIR